MVVDHGQQILLELPPAGVGEMMHSQVANIPVMRGIRFEIWVTQCVERVGFVEARWKTTTS